MKADVPRMPPVLKVDSHVLVQLGSELVTDVEQAILECVKNAYDADSPGCRIEIDTTASGVIDDADTVERLRLFDHSSESVAVELLDATGKPLDVDPKTLESDVKIIRRLTWRGRITIADTGDGMTDEQLLASWLVVSRSSKRAEDGHKTETTRKRTPLGDKGLGRLGTMKLGDILNVASATGPTESMNVARFRWADCEATATVDAIPVTVTREPNAAGFKGTNVTVFGLKDLASWQRKSRLAEIAGRLTRLISPFETKSKFRVGLVFDGQERSLAAVTAEVLDSCIARFDFEWDGTKLRSKARFRSRLFKPTRMGKLRDKAEYAFVPDGGAKFLAYLKTFNRFKDFEIPEVAPAGWFFDASYAVEWNAIEANSGDGVGETENPGPFAGSFYYFHLDSLADDPHQNALLGINSKVIKDMAGVSILREGFQVRSQGDWLDLAAGMTSGSTYQLRVSNTIGYFALSGRKNYLLIEKSDREGFVENAAYRGFLAITRECARFANETLEAVRRGFDEYAKKVDSGPRQLTADASLDAVERESRAYVKARVSARDVTSVLRSEIEQFEQSIGDGTSPPSLAFETVKSMASRLEGIATAFEAERLPEGAVGRIRAELDDNREQMAALFESAAVGLSARGMAHELRTHLTEIRTRTSQIERFVKTHKEADWLVGHLRAIKGACTEIQKSAALIDPMLPRSRATKETFDLNEFVRTYCNARGNSFERAGIKVAIENSQEPMAVRTNRTRLLQALDNLMRNSAYWVTRPRLVSETLEQIIMLKIGQYELRVADNGPGVDPRYEESLFEIFVSGRPDRDGGQGLGLFITRYLLEAMGCSVALTPERNAKERRYCFLMDLGAIAAVKDS